MVSFSVRYESGSALADLCGRFSSAGGLVSCDSPCSIILAIVADLPRFIPLPTFLSSFLAVSSGMLMLIILRSPARCFAM